MASCLHCGKNIGPIRSRKDRDFCSNVHRERYHNVFRNALLDSAAGAPPEKVERAVHVRPSSAVLVSTGPSVKRQIPRSAEALTAVLAAVDCAPPPVEAVNPSTPSVAAVRFPAPVLPFARDNALGTAARIRETQDAVDGAASLKLLEDRPAAAAVISIPGQSDRVPAWKGAPATAASILRQPGAGKDFVQPWQGNVSPAMLSLPLAILWRSDGVQVASPQPAASAHFSLSSSTLEARTPADRIAHAPEPVGLLSPISIRLRALPSVRTCFLYSAGSRRFQPDLHPTGVTRSMPRAVHFRQLPSARLLPDFASTRTQWMNGGPGLSLSGTPADSLARSNASVNWRHSTGVLSNPAMETAKREAHCVAEAAKQLDGAGVRGTALSSFASEPQLFRSRIRVNSSAARALASGVFTWIPVPAKSLETAPIPLGAGVSGSELGPAPRWQPILCRLTAPQEAGAQLRWRFALPKSLEGAPLQELAAAIVFDLQPRRLLPAPQFATSGLSLTPWNQENPASQSKKNSLSFLIRFPKIVPMFVRSSLAGGALASACLLFMSSHLHIGNLLAQGRGLIGRTVQSRAVLDYREDFHAGLSHWRGGTNWAHTWSFDKAGFVRTGQLALYKPSLEFTDYRLDFLGQIDRKGLGWVFRAEDLQNYYAVKLNVAEEGPRRRLVLVRYAVIGGTESPHIEVPARVMAMNNSPAEISLTVSGNEFSVAVEGQTIDAWSDDHLTSGGIGFFTEKSGRARVYHMRLSNHDDLLGRLCAVLIPVSLAGTNATRRLP